MSFENKVAVVAGAGGGMGLNIANDLIAEGVHVTLADIKAQPDDIQDGPGKHRYLQGNLADEDFVREVIDQAADEFGGLDYLVNTTGVLWFDRDKSFVEMDLDVWDQVYNINLKSFVMTSRYAVPHMKKRGGGAMVHFASVDALHGELKAQDAYATSKAAIIRFSKSIAIQFAADGIRSNTILPGQVLSPMQDRWQGKPELKEKAAEAVPLGRLGSTQDQSNACLFLLSDKASYITGIELIVDGGVTAQV